MSVGELVRPSPLGHVGIGIFGFILPILFGLAISPGFCSSSPPSLSLGYSLVVFLVKSRSLLSCSLSVIWPFNLWFL